MSKHIQRVDAMAEFAEGLSRGTAEPAKKKRKPPPCKNLVDRASEAVLGTEARSKHVLVCYLRGCERIHQAESSHAARPQAFLALG
jgi:hypothetical protein